MAPQECGHGIGFQPRCCAINTPGWPALLRFPTPCVARMAGPRAARPTRSCWMCHGFRSQFRVGGTASASGPASPAAAQRNPTGRPLSDRSRNSTHFTPSGLTISPGTRNDVVQPLRPGTRFFGTFAYNPSIFPWGSGQSACCASHGQEGWDPACIIYPLVRAKPSVGSGALLGTFSNVVDGGSWRDPGLKPLRPRCSPSQPWQGSPSSTDRACRCVKIPSNS